MINYNYELYCLEEELDYFNSLPKEEQHDSIGHIITIKDKILHLNTIKDTLSTNLFPNHSISIYNDKTDHKALSNHPCLFCYNEIKRGQTYYNFRPLIIDNTTKDRYILHHHTKAKICEWCYSSIPNNIYDLENLLLEFDIAQKNIDLEKSEKILQIINLTDGFTLKKIMKSR